MRHSRRAPQHHSRYGGRQRQEVPTRSPAPVRSAPDAGSRRAIGYPQSKPPRDRPSEPGEEEQRPVSRQIMTSDEVRRALVRIGHEIVEKHGGTDDLALVGIQRRGVPAGASHRRGHRGERGRAAPRRQPRHHVLPRRPDARRPAAAAQGHEPPLRPRARPPSSSSTTCCTPGAPSAPPWTRWSTRVDPPRSASRCSSTAAIGSCPSGPTTWARTCPRPATRWSTCASPRSTSRDEVVIERREVPVGVA